jgi:hypothetical protein
MGLAAAWVVAFWAASPFCYPESLIPRVRGDWGAITIAFCLRVCVGLVTKGMPEFRSIASVA